MRFWKPAVSVVLFCLAATANATTYYVSPSGNDANTGTLGLPLKTITRAAAKAQPGDDISVRGGLYNQVVTISSIGQPASRISFHAFPGEQPVIDGTGLGADRNLVTFYQAAFVDFSGFEVRNATRIGICGWDSNNIRVAGNTVHDATRNGIYFGSDSMGVVSDIIVDGNTVYHTVLENQYHTMNGGWASALVISWCDRGSITNNKVYENSGEGLGFLLSNSGLVQQNVVFDNYSVEIYLDNARSITVNRNLAYSTGNATYFRDGFPAAGIGTANESYAASNPLSGLTIINNIVINTKWGFYYGAYGNGGGLKNALVANNTFYKSSVAVLWIENDAHANSVIEDNIFDQAGGLGMTSVAGAGVTYQNNAWYGGNAGAAAGVGDLIGDPLLVNPGSLVATDYELKAGSSLINRGLVLAAVTTDYSGLPRGASNDLGAQAFSTSGGNTGQTPPDSQAPAAPTALKATVAASVITLQWTAPWDNVGVTGYCIYRNGSLVKTTAGVLTSWTDTAIAGGAFTYYVKALDAAGNISAASASVTVKIAKRRP